MSNKFNFRKNERKNKEVFFLDNDNNTITNYNYPSKHRRDILSKKEAEFEAWSIVQSINSI